MSTQATGFWVEYLLRAMPKDSGWKQLTGTIACMMWPAGEG
jgi:hypothetical protein